MKAIWRLASITMFVVAIGGIAACAKDNGDANKRTFALKYIDERQAGELFRTYAPWPDVMVQMSAADSTRTLQVTAPPEKMAEIEKLIAKYDVPAPDAHLFFQVIEADGFTTKDPEIADVEAALRGVFKFTGYRLLASAAINSRTPGSFDQWAGGEYMLSGQVSATRATDAVNLDINLATKAGPPMLRTSVTIPNGQIVVVGSSRPDASKPTVILVVRTKKE